MDNASLIYDSLKNYKDIKALIGTQEDIFLDFKESRTSTGALLDDDKAHFSKAASGFAHQQGGVLVWGIEARKGEDGIDEATDLKPISNIKGFLSALNDHRSVEGRADFGGADDASEISELRAPGLGCKACNGSGPG